MNYDFNIELFTKNLLSKNHVDISLYKDPKFCNEMRLYALERIKFLLLDIFRSHLPNENEGNHALLLSAKGIHIVDQHGLNLLDYCTIAGFDDFGCMFAKLGCTNTIDIQQFSNRINKNFNKGNTPPMIASINKALKHIKMELKKYNDNPTHGNNKHNSSLWKKIKHAIKNFPYKKHKFAILILSFGTICLIVAPFTGGLSSILLLTLGFPSILAGLSSLQSTIETLNGHQQSEESSRMAHEVELLKIIHKDICDQVKIQVLKMDIDDDYNKSKGLNQADFKTKNLMFFNLHNKDQMPPPKTKKKFLLIA